jgi:hypothetical protein
MPPEIEANTITREEAIDKLRELTK